MTPIIRQLPNNRTQAHYYTGYVNHMWSLFVRYPDAPPPTANDIDRNDWQICHDIYHELRSIEKDLVFARFTPDRAQRDSAVRFTAEAAGISDNAAAAILFNISAETAAKRGLIQTRMPGYPKQNTPTNTRQE